MNYEVMEIRNELSEFHQIDSDSGELCGLTFSLLGHHTNGSIALFDPASECLFCGDHVCFFGDPVPSDSLVTVGDGLRAKTAAFVSGWSESPEDRLKYRFDIFVAGLRLLSLYTESKFLATGHGPVLSTQIPAFLSGLIP